VRRTSRPDRSAPLSRRHEMLHDPPRPSPPSDRSAWRWGFGCCFGKGADAMQTAECSTRKQNLGQRAGVRSPRSTIRSSADRCGSLSSSGRVDCTKRTFDTVSTHHISIWKTITPGRYSVPASDVAEDAPKSPRANEIARVDMVVRCARSAEPNNSSNAGLNPRSITLSSNWLFFELDGLSVQAPATTLKVLDFSWP